MKQEKVEIGDVNAILSNPYIKEYMPKHYAVANAMKWRSGHEDHVKKLEGDGGPCFAPSTQDMRHPELWKSGSWRWLRKYFVS